MTDSVSRSPRKEMLWSAHPIRSKRVYACFFRRRLQSTIRVVVLQMHAFFDEELYHTSVKPRYTRRYFKKFRVSDLDRIGVKPVQSNLSVAHANNTLIISVNACIFGRLRRSLLNARVMRTVHTSCRVPGCPSPHYCM